MSRILVVVLLLAQLVLVGFAVERIWDDPPFVDPDDGVTVAGTVVPSMDGTLESGLALAQDRARAWDPTARLVLVSEQVDWPLDPPSSGPVSIAPGGWLTYVFASDSSRALGLELERYTGDVARTAESDWPDQPGEPSLPLGELPVTSEIAIKTVEQAAGRDFRAQCPAVRSRSIVTLSRGSATGGTDNGQATPSAEGTPRSATAVASDSRNLVWLVTYADRGANDSVALIASVDAMTGELLRVENDINAGATPCGL